jgi:DNA-binding NtrC family response regulator
MAAKKTFQGVRETLAHNLHLLGDSPAFQKVVEQCSRIAPYDVTVLLLGETGTGKELIARALHFLSPRASSPFVPADCAAIPESLFAHELFGHERGAFTDARETKLGLLASASGGTLFLDEVESLPLSAQGTLLRLLDSHEWRPLGSTKWKPLGCRIIAATNEDLATLVEKGLFRRDLYYRLTTAICHLPPLRERTEDIPLLTQRYLSLFCQTFQREALTVSEEALSLLNAYPWPGNIRELQNCLQHAVVNAAGPVLKPTDLFLSMTPRPVGEDPGAFWRESRRQALAAWERMFLARTLQRKSGNLTQVAQQLNLSRMQLYRLLKKYHLHSPQLGR